MTGGVAQKGHSDYFKFLLWRRDFKSRFAPNKRFTGGDDFLSDYSALDAVTP
jgi:hypothetical protein